MYEGNFSVSTLFFFYDAFSVSDRQYFSYIPLDMMNLKFSDRCTRILFLQNFAELRLFKMLFKYFFFFAKGYIRISSFCLIRIPFQMFVYSMLFNLVALTMHSVRRNTNRVVQFAYKVTLVFSLQIRYFFTNG